MSAEGSELEAATPAPRAKIAASHALPLPDGATVETIDLTRVHWGAWQGTSIVAMPANPGRPAPRSCPRPTCALLGCQHACETPDDDALDALVVAAGVVHRWDCDTRPRRAVGVRRGAYGLDDRPCSRCLPDGLPPGR